MSVVEAGPDDLTASPSIGSAARYRALIGYFLVGILAGGVAILVALAVLDPYETGEFGLLPSVHWQGNLERTSVAANPAFNSAIIGSSRMMLLRPSLLSDRTGLKFVSLGVIGTEAREHLIVLRYYLQHHPSPRALVFGLDETWCLNPLRMSKSFKEWPYQSDLLTYAAHLYGMTTVTEIQALFETIRHSQGALPADGLMDFEPAFHAAGADRPEIVRAKLAQPRPTVPFTSTTDLPAATELRESLSAVPAATVVILAWEPTYITMIPQPGSAAERALNTCRAAFQEIATARPRTAVVDWFVDRPENRDEANFLDLVHYRHGVATAFGEDIAGAINRSVAVGSATVRKE
jgi:hypothetical protein